MGGLANMEKLSRVKKYEDLRKSIETDNHVDQGDEALLHNEQTLKQFDSSVLKKAEISEEHYQPEREKAVEVQESKPVSEEADFTNEYLDDFIQEVRTYNIRKGTRECENTQVDILQQLNAVNRAKRSQYVEPIPAEEPKLEPGVKPLLSKDDIALEVANLLKDDEEESAAVICESEEEKAKQPDVSKTQIVHMFSDEIETVKEEEPVKAAEEEEEVPPKKKGFFKRKKEAVEEVEEEEAQEEEKKVDPVLHKKLLEETQQLRVQMDEYEDELTDLSDGVEKTNKLLNFVLCFLILVLLVIIGFIAYSLLKAGGKI